MPTIPENRASISFTGPMKLKEIRRRVAAYESLCDVTPEIWVRGDFWDVKTKEVVFGSEFSGLRVVRLGRTLITAMVDGEPAELSPEMITYLSLSFA